MAEWHIKIIDNLLGKSRAVDELYEDVDYKGFEFKPIITISRDPGSGGKPIAEAVAKKLKFNFYDQELIKEVAKSAKARQEIIKEIDEKQRSLVEDFIHDTINPEYISEERYMKNLLKVIIYINQRGKAVILGRGSNFMVPAAFALRVRVTAPYRVCVARAVRYENVPYQKAREIINKVTDERAAFVKQYFGKNIRDSKYYDLTLNTAFMTIPDATQVVIEAFKHKFGLTKLA
jgi:cytidylate kinase